MRTRSPTEYVYPVDSLYLTALLFAIIGGFVASVLRLPPLIGFLGAGFAISAIGLESIPFVDNMAELGVTTLLFTIGLKLNPRDIAGPRVIGSATGHAVANTVIFAVIFGIASLLPLRELTGLSLTSLIFIGIATSFSSTVFVMSQLEEQSRSGSAVGRIAIGVLVLQDIIAVGVLVASSGRRPEIWALALPLVLLLRPLVTRMPDRMFRTELLVLTGIGIAVGAYSFCELAGLSGSLGSLLAGILLSGHPVADRFSSALVSVRELLLVGFFLQIGLGGLPNFGGFLIAGILILALIAKAAIFIVIIHRVGMNRRTSVLSGLTLANYSEFGLIVIAVAVERGVLGPSWTSIMAIAVAGSFIVGSIVADKEEKLLHFILHWVSELPESRLAPDERPVRVANADALVFGMGRVGLGVYHRLRDEYGLRVYGIDFDEERIERLRGSGHNIISGDVTDFELWQRIQLEYTPRLIVLAIPAHFDAIQVLRTIRETNPTIVVASTSQVRAHTHELLDDGADVAVYLYDGAGEELADQAMRAVLSQEVL
ncbi:Glutathione-regulated potassium-efflux system protein KefC [Corynebacterium kalinowskii]|uniref:Glutathione-regulated potassium-efflux system protein KefC n=1 Tax=Corynebacterium kalinowskii TaxID=2675216 RepID=A0A6B8V8Z7_9CORY|nr:Glutathione-regulated potassium-efflux system protein KefC [Corynebacterium kalinowskii]